jgi:hypothetical protein
MSALFGALAARLGAALAVFRFMLLALGGTGGTDVGTEPADLVDEVRPPAHEGRSGPAHLCTIPIQADALGHLRYFRFPEAGVGAMLALLSTTNAGIDP